eukprot:CAMPEP_0176445192 /NCGR_PEP_ID=MMETSP0127-20121128/23539_1 /TAXON_ID=938130 /ORGANISM="Platyophrya macrostoma, Strain WH" /LENGTH=540 /DNA_ID=CAMNT_0017830899 /DNA_START=39 /DNA_END=1661 /DNA_ORIENTATION=+
MTFQLPELYCEEGIFGPPSDSKLSAVFADAKHVVDGLKSAALDRATHRWSALDSGNDWWDYVVLNKRSLEELRDEAAITAPVTSFRPQGGRAMQPRKHYDFSRGRGRGGNNGRGGKRGGRSTYQPREEITPMRDTFVMKDGERLRDFDFDDLVKRGKQFDTSVVVTDLKLCGLPRVYATEVERARITAPRKLQECPETMKFKGPTAFQDPVLRLMVRSIEGDLPVIVATEEALSSLMACTRSIHAWHIKCFRFKRFTFLETVEHGKTDVEWVAETNTMNGPSETAIMTENRASALGAESTAVAKEFVAHSILKTTCNISTEKRHDDFKGMTPMFRYRRYDIGGSSPFIVLVRSEIDAGTPNPQKPNSFLYLRLFGLLEHAASHQWQDTSAASNILTTELKHNSFKVARWIARSVLSGADLMKIGLISRNKTANQHNLVGIISQDPTTLGSQVGVTSATLWSNAIALLTALLQESEKCMVNGQANLFFVKNANNNVIELISQDTDGNDDNDEEEEEEEGEEEEEEEEEEDEGEDEDEEGDE